MSDAPRKNRLTDMISQILFTPASATAKTYANDDGSKVRKLASVRLELAMPDGKGKMTGSGIYLHGAVNARQAVGATKAKAVFSFIGKQYENAISTIPGSDASVDVEMFKASVADQYADWRKKSPAAASAIVDNSGVELDGVSL